MNSDQKIVVILGTTASGKSALSIEVAKLFSGEIICADSRTIYKGMDIGTAKPSLKEQKLVSHYGLDLIEPNQIFSAAEFKRYAHNVVNDIHGRNRLPIIVGGSGLYIDGYVYDFDFSAQPDPKLRNNLEDKSLLQLQQQATQLGITSEDSSFVNHRHLSRKIERLIAGHEQAKQHPKPNNILLVGLSVESEQLRQRIEQRVDTMFTNGLVEEVQNVVSQYGGNAPGLQAPGYKAVIEYLNGNIDLEMSKQQFVRNDWQLSRRQRTWFKRNPDIIWCDGAAQAEQVITQFMNN